MLNIVRRIVSEGRAPRDPDSGQMGRRGTPPSDSFTTAEVYAFTRELEKLHPDNSESFREQVVTSATKSASNCRSCAMLDCSFISVVANGNCRDVVIRWHKLKYVFDELVQIFLEKVVGTFGVDGKNVD